MFKEVLLEAKQLTKEYYLPRTSLLKKPQVLKAVHGVDLKIYKGEVFGLVGESGCGKSTLGKTIMKIIDPQAGQILFNGKDISNTKGRELKNLRKKMQMIFQDPSSSLNPRKTIGWTLEEPLRVHGIGDSKSRKKKAEEMLELVGLTKEYLHRYPHELSGGQKQRIAILSALMLEPELIVADEAVSSLDVSIQAQILNLLKEIQEVFRLTYLFISHDLNVVYYMSDRIGVMYLGSMVEIGDAEQVFHHPKHPYTQALFSAILSINDQEQKEREVLTGDVPSPTHLPKGCPFVSRCKKAMPICSEKMPPFIEEANHGVRCFLYREVKAKKGVQQYENRHDIRPPS